MRTHRIQALLRKHYYLSTNGISRTFDMLYWPVFGLILFGLTNLFVEEQGVNITIFLIGGIIFWVFFERLQQDINIYLLEDFWSGNLANEYATPITSAERLVALSITALTRGIISFGFMTIIAILLYNYNPITISIPGLLYAIPLFLTAWGLGALVAGIVLQHGIRLQMIAWAIATLIQPIAAVYYPVSILPEWLQTIAYLTPLAHIFEGYRAATQGTFSIETLILATILATIYFLAGYLWFIHSEHKAKETGMIAEN